MPKIKGPNGLTIEVNDVTAEGLLKSKGEYELVVDGVESAEDKAARKAAEKAAAKAAKAATPPAPAGSDPVKPEWPKGTTTEWADYAKHLGLSVEGQERAAIREAVEAHEAAKAN